MDPVVYSIAPFTWLAQADDIYFVSRISCSFSKTECPGFIGIPIKGDYTNTK
jgi:hypothetical protein